jgi:hypothetical protein
MNITETIQDPVVLTVTPKIKSNRQHFITIRVHEMYQSCQTCQLNLGRFC